eukprot:sb/3468736/
MFSFIVLSLLLQLAHSVSVSSIVVKTGPGKYDGTGDTLTMTIYGSTGDAERIYLGKGFTVGSSRTISRYRVGVINNLHKGWLLCVVCMKSTHDIGTPECVVFQTSGEDLWRPKEVTLTTKDGQHFSFPNTRGIGLSNKEDHLSSGWAAAIGFCTPITESTVGRRRKCTIKTRTSTTKNAKTDNCLMVPRIYGDAGVVVGESMDNIKRNDFETGALDTFTFQNMQNVGRVRYVSYLFYFLVFPTATYLLDT